MKSKGLFKVVASHCGMMLNTRGSWHATLHDSARMSGERHGLIPLLCSWAIFRTISALYLGIGITAVCLYLSMHGSMFYPDSQNPSFQFDFEHLDSVVTVGWQHLSSSTLTWWLLLLAQAVLRQNSPKVRIPTRLCFQRNNLIRNLQHSVRIWLWKCNSRILLGWLRRICTYEMVNIFQQSFENQP